MGERQRLLSQHSSMETVSATMNDEVDEMDEEKMGRAAGLCLCHPFALEDQIGQVFANPKRKAELRFGLAAADSRLLNHARIRQGAGGFSWRSTVLQRRTGRQLCTRGRKHE